MITTARSRSPRRWRHAATRASSSRGATATSAMARSMPNFSSSASRRRGARRREALLEKFGMDLAIADVAVAPRLDEARVAACLQRLGERERAVVIMSFYDDQPADRVGAALGLTA